ncbi:hypothetical protein M758_4G143300 [Ceratodon purpureus]|uniref:Uncharacterized protein n=1 Tax=Ceratodon purpureus TaxID=3225 RepID=A0A8T0IAL9_CERPU|nr:hypothetical protein KC19_4G141800 [Ceratodon purpureus]KAG0619488.1 hypothetical protein M758_4G143300 [Ceratodon purpureus]
MLTTETMSLQPNYNLQGIVYDPLHLNLFLMYVRRLQNWSMFSKWVADPLEGSLASRLRRFSTHWKCGQNIILAASFSERRYDGIPLRRDSYKFDGNLISTL